MPNELTALNTRKPNNRFEQRIYIRVTPEGTIQPLDKRKRRAAEYEFVLQLEYPSYEDELKIKALVTKYDEQHQIHFTDYALLTEERVRRCLVQWDIHEKLPQLTKKLHRIRGELEDDSMSLWKELPPLLRKTIADRINIALGAS